MTRASEPDLFGRHRLSATNPRISMKPKLILTAALTGAGATTHKSPAVPITPKAIAEEAIRAAQAGAPIVHIHVRDPATGDPSMDMQLYREVVNRIRDSATDVVINLTTGPGARFVPHPTDASLTGPGSTMCPPERRVEHVLELRPEMCSLDVATFNFGPHAFVNVPADLDRMAALIQAAGVRPELEVFDVGHVRLARHMIENGVVQGVPVFQFCLDVPWGAPATVQSFLAMRELLPSDAQWSAFGISSQQYPTLVQAALLGGNIRVGLEDNLHLRRGVLAKSNAELVQRARDIVELMDWQIATPAEVRERWQLKKQ